MTLGVLPNSPPHHRTVLESRPRCDRSWSKVAMPLSICGSFWRITWKFCRWVSRSEEHTSELQSLRHLVCRLLLEKKIFLDGLRPVVRPDLYADRTSIRLNCC